jgi:hypothetical protein
MAKAHIAFKKKGQGQTMIYNTLHRKLKIKQLKKPLKTEGELRL